MTQTLRTLYTAKVHVTGGRSGAARSSDGRLDLQLAPPGAAGAGTNPEQLLAAGWSACFEGAMAIAAKERQIALPDDLAIDAEIDLNAIDGAYELAARLRVSVPGVAPELARALIEAAHRTCPYSKALSGNVDIAIDLA